MSGIALRVLKVLTQSSQCSYELGTIIIPIEQTRKLRHKAIKISFITLIRDPTPSKNKWNPFKIIKTEMINARQCGDFIWRKEVLSESHKLILTRSITKHP